MCPFIRFPSNAYVNSRECESERTHIHTSYKPDHISSLHLKFFLPFNFTPGSQVLLIKSNKRCLDVVVSYGGQQTILLSTKALTHSTAVFKNSQIRSIVYIKWSRFTQFQYETCVFPLLHNLYATVLCCSNAVRQYAQCTNVWYRVIPIFRVELCWYIKN